MKLSILGPPGSGKGTVSELLEKKYKFLHWSAGELLREQIRQGTAIGKKIKPIVERGDLVPDDITVGLVKKKVLRKKHYILDGFPRTLYQAQQVADLGIDRVIFLDVPEKEVIKRLSGRRVCAKGLHNYHLQYIPPQKAGVCDVDGSALQIRKDDYPAAIKERFEVFCRQTKPVIALFQKNGILVRVNAAKSPAEVYRNVKKGLHL